MLHSEMYLTSQTKQFNHLLNGFEDAFRHLMEE